MSSPSKQNACFGNGSKLPCFFLSNRLLLTRLIFEAGFTGCEMAAQGLQNGCKMAASLQIGYWLPGLLNGCQWLPRGCKMAANGCPVAAQWLQAANLQSMIAFWLLASSLQPICSHWAAIGSHLADLQPTANLQTCSHFAAILQPFAAILQPVKPASKMRWADSSKPESTSRLSNGSLDTRSSLS